MKKIAVEQLLKQSKELEQKINTLNREKGDVDDKIRILVKFLWKQVPLCYYQNRIRFSVVHAYG